MLSGVAAFFQTQTIHRFRARLTMSALLSFHYTLRARACLWTAFWKDIDSLDFPKIKNKLKHFTGHRMDPLIQLCSSLNGWWNKTNLPRLYLLVPSFCLSRNQPHQVICHPRMNCIQQHSSRITGHDKNTSSGSCKGTYIDHPSVNPTLADNWWFDTTKVIASPLYISQQNTILQGDKRKWRCITSQRSAFGWLNTLRNYLVLLAVSLLHSARPDSSAPLRRNGLKPIIDLFSTASTQRLMYGISLASSLHSDFMHGIYVPETQCFSKFLMQKYVQR